MLTLAASENQLSDMTVSCKTSKGGWFTIHLLIIGLYQLHKFRIGKVLLSGSCLLKENIIFKIVKRAFFSALSHDKSLSVSIPITLYQFFTKCMFWVHPRSSCAPNSQSAERKLSVFVFGYYSSPHVQYSTTCTVLHVLYVK